MESILNNLYSIFIWCSVVFVLAGITIGWSIGFIVARKFYDDTYNSEQRNLIKRIATIMREKE